MITELLRELWAIEQEFLTTQVPSYMYLSLLTRPAISAAFLITCATLFLGVCGPNLRIWAPLQAKRLRQPR